MNDKVLNWSFLMLFVGVCIGVEIIASALTFPSVKDWYPTLEKPSWNPPKWLFGPVWTYLYLSMGLAAWLVWRERRNAAIKVPMILFGVQLVLNCAWTAIFFGMQNIELGFYEIVLLWVAILITTVSFWKIEWIAGALFIPYLIWVGYAAALNFSIWRMNL